MMDRSNRIGNSCTYSQQVIKDRNSTLLFNLVRKMAPISRAELSRLSGLSPATVTVLMEELLASQWIRELPMVPTAGTRGRRPIQLEVNASAGYIVTVEIRSTGCVCTLYDICLNQIASVPSKIHAPSAEVICQIIRDLVANYDSDRLLGIHVLYPGLFDTETGALGFSAVIPEPDRVDAELIRILKLAFPQVLVMLNNDATAMAYSVFAAHSSETPLPLLALSIQEGINAGIVTKSLDCIPVEAGHIIIQQDGPTCMCGNHGCLEAFCSTPALFRKIQERTSLKLTYRSTYGAEENQIAMQQVAEALRRGDPEVVSVLREYAYSLCAGIVSIVNLFAVRSVYLVGTVCILGAPFVELVREALVQHFQVVTNSRQVTLALFDDDTEASRKAAVLLTLERIFRRS